MSRYRNLTRRMAISDLGKAGLAVIVLGAACAPGDGEALETTTSVSPTTTGGSPDTTPGTSPPASQPSLGTMHQRVRLEIVSAYILYRAGEAALIDTGVAHSADAVGSALTEVGLSWDSVGQIILTHKHPDHIGSLAEALSQATGAAVYAGAGDIPAIASPVPISAVGNGDTVFDLTIIESPGHTAGHISVLDPISGVLVTGDALNGADGGVIGPNPDFTEDMTRANESVAVLAGFEYEVALFGHGEPVLEGASAAVAALAAGLG